MRFEQELLFDALKLILSDGQSTKEFDLLQKLQQPPWELFDRNALSTELQLFQTHFTLFNTLYTLQDYWLNAGQGYLKISALQIQLLEDEGTGLLDTAEQNIKAYYNDWQNFSKTTEKDVEALLDSFWAAFGNFINWQVPEAQQIEAALQFFALPAKSSWQEIKRRYLKFQLNHHPDRGGNEQVSKDAAHHFDVLKRYFKLAA